VLVHGANDVLLTFAGTFEALAAGGLVLVGLLLDLLEVPLSITAASFCACSSSFVYSRPSGCFGR
jgi:hypothetical protein